MKRRHTSKEIFPSQDLKNDPKDQASITEKSIWVGKYLDEKIE